MILGFAGSFERITQGAGVIIGLIGVIYHPRVQMQLWSDAYTGFFAVSGGMARDARGLSERLL